MGSAFSGKVVLITGAAAGIGKATAQAFAAEGARLILADIDTSNGEATVAAIREQGGDAVCCECKVADDAQVQSMLEMIERDYGRLDCAFNNAGVEFEQDKLADVDETEFNRNMDVISKGVWQYMRFEIPLILNSRGCVIVNTASIAALGAAPKMSIYAASKHAVLGLTRSAAVEYGFRGIRINAVCPAVIDTDMYRRAVEAEPRKAESVARLHPIDRKSTRLNS